MKLTFKEGKIVEIEGSDLEELGEIVNTDEGARYIGEFTLGVNLYLTSPIKGYFVGGKDCW
ncbi:MAG: aminopeptidase [Clostridiales bacterium]|nr:aminopeptidase [Clostridiales bacterium]